MILPKQEDSAKVLCALSWGVSQVALVVKNLPANAGDVRDAGLIPGWGRFPLKEERAIHS